MFIKFVFLFYFKISAGATRSMSSSRTVILGGGIHGASTAYYLSKKGIKTTIVEQSYVGSAASGKAGGFLAKDWGSGCTTQLHHVSYRMHQQLAHELNIESFREISTLSVDSNRRGRSASQCSWLDKNVHSSSMDSGKYNSSQKHTSVKYVS